MICVGKKRLVKAIYHGKNILRFLINGNNIVFTNAIISILGPKTVNSGDTNKYILTINDIEYGNSAIMNLQQEGCIPIEMIFKTFNTTKNIDVYDIDLSFN